MQLTPFVLGTDDVRATRRNPRLERSRHAAIPPRDWAHLYPSSPSPTYRVLASRHDGTHSEFVATVYLCASPVGRGHTYSLSSSVHHQEIRAIQEVAADAIILLRTHDPLMKKCVRYIHLPRLDLSNGDVFFPGAWYPSPEVTTLLQYTSYLHQYLHDTLPQLPMLHSSMTAAEVAGAPGPSSSRQIPPYPAHLPLTLDQLRGRLASTPARATPFRSSSAPPRFFTGYTQEPQAQCLHVNIGTPFPSYTPRTLGRSINGIDTIAPATPLEM